MACEDITPENPHLFGLVAGKLLDGIEKGLSRNGLKPIKRTYVGMGPVPSEDCCPDLVAWITNVRIFDQQAPDTLAENRVLIHFGMAFDINIRIGECFFEVDPENPKALVAPKQIEQWANVINDYGQVAYWEGLKAMLHDPDLQCGTSITPGYMNPYQGGGCGGFQFAITVGVLP